MDEKKNNEMSVDELLEKLRASLQTDDDVKVSHTDTEDDDIKKAIAAALGTEEVADEKAENVAEEAVDATAEEPAEASVADDSRTPRAEPVTIGVSSPGNSYSFNKSLISISTNSNNSGSSTWSALFINTTM